MALEVKYDGSDPTRLLSARDVESVEVKRITATVRAKRYEVLEETQAAHGVRMADGVRIGLNIFAAAIPLLSSGGEFVFRDNDGSERAYSFPFLIDSGQPRESSTERVIQPSDYYSCFISYSHNDREFALRLCEKLHLDGIDCWLDYHEMLPGDDLYDKVERAIVRGDKVLLCCSESSLTSWWVENELNIGFEKEQKIFQGDRPQSLGSCAS